MQIEVPANKTMWEILVPTILNGKPIRTRFHKVWDNKIREITKGLTILPPTKGHWISPEGELFEERMIPVRIFCSGEDIAKIADFTAQYYNQRAIMYYMVSNQVYIRHYVEQRKKGSPSSNKTKKSKQVYS